MKNKLTSIFGIIAAGGALLYQGGFFPKITGTAAAFATLLLGIFAKDYNVTGGSVPATPEATKRIQ